MAMQGFDMMLKMAGIDPTALEAKAKAVFDGVRAEVQAEFAKLHTEVAHLHDRFASLELRLSEAVKPEAPATGLAAVGTVTGLASVGTAMPVNPAPTAAEVEAATLLQQGQTSPEHGAGPLQGE